MPIYRGTTPLKAYKGDMQPVNVYRGSTKVAGWHLASYSGTSPLTVDCDYNVTPDALTVDGKCSQVQSCWGTNLVTNGDFSNGTTGWTSNNAIISSTNRELTVLGSAANSDARHYNIAMINSHMYCFRALVKATSSKVSISVGGVGASNHSGSGNYELLKTIYLWGSSTGNWTFFISDDRTSGWDNIYVKYAIVIDLTAAFGAGKEPTAAQMDAIMAQYPNSWFDGSAQLSTDTTKYTPNSPGPSFPAPISTITGDMTITGADGESSDTATVAFGSAVCASLPDGTHDSYDAVTGVLTKRVGKYVGASGTSWTISDAATSASFMSDRIPSGTMSGQTVTSSAVCTPTIYYKLSTPTTVQLTPHLPVVRTGIKTLSIGADVVPTLSATVKSMESAITSITQG